MRAQFVRGIDPKDSMNIGNKHAREGQKMIAAFKEIDPTFEPRITDDKNSSIEAVAVSVFIKDKVFSLIWIGGEPDYYWATWDYQDSEKKGEGDTFKKLEQAQKRMQEYLIINERKI